MCGVFARHYLQVGEFNLQPTIAVLDRLYSVQAFQPCQGERISLLLRCFLPVRSLAAGSRDAPFSQEAVVRLISRPLPQLVRGPCTVLE
jgi:hypothetical protein